MAHTYSIWCSSYSTTTVQLLQYYLTSGETGPTVVCSLFNFYLLHRRMSNQTHASFRLSKVKLTTQPEYGQETTKDQSIFCIPYYSINFVLEV